MMMMRNANRVSEVNAIISWSDVRNIPGRNAGRLFFLRETLWDRWSRGLNFAREMCFPKGGSCCKLRSECVTEKLSVCCCNEDGQTKSHVKNVVMLVSRGLTREIDSVKEIGSNEVGGVGEESNVMKPDEYTNEIQYVVGRMSAVELTQDCCENRNRRISIS